jgi:hypothetical protein
MGESKYHNSHMVAFQQEVRRLEEKFDGFELHHILRRDNVGAAALARLELSDDPPPLGVFTQDLFKPSIRLEEDIPVCSPGASLDGAARYPYQGLRWEKTVQHRY